MVIDTETFLKLNHGTIRAYNEGCRCSFCTESMAIYRRNRRRDSKDLRDTPGPRETARSVQEIQDIMVELGMAEYSEDWDRE